MSRRVGVWRLIRFGCSHWSASDTCMGRRVFCATTQYLAVDPLPAYPLRLQTGCPAVDPHRLLSLCPAVDPLRRVTVQRLIRFRAWPGLAVHPLFPALRNVVARNHFRHELERALFSYPRAAAEGGGGNGGDGGQGGPRGVRGLCGNGGTLAPPPAVLSTLIVKVSAASSSKRCCADHRRTLGRAASYCIWTRSPRAIPWGPRDGRSQLCTRASWSSRISCGAKRFGWF